MPKELSGYDFLFIDSVNSHNLSPAEIETIIKKPPRLSIVYLCQTTKQGLFRGSKELEHLADVVIKIENGKAHPEKNRFGGRGEITIY